MDNLPADVLLKMSESDRIKALEILSVLEQRRVQEGARKDFMQFVRLMWEGFIPGQHHQKMANAFERVARGELKRLIINMPPRHPLALDTPVPTPIGWATIGTLCKGDKVFSSKGLPVKVKGKSEVFTDRELYKVTTDDGYDVICDSQHLWTVRLDRKSNTYHEFTTEQLWLRQEGTHDIHVSSKGKVTVIERTSKRLVKSRLPKLPKMPVVEYENKKLVVDPYVLGLWLGDGDKKNGIISSHDDDGVYVRAQIHGRGYATADQRAEHKFSILGLKAKLREIRVLDNKHIPQVYMEGSVQQRRDLIKGLMDSDGCVTKSGQCIFCQKSKSFIDAVRKVLTSLGIKNTVQAYTARIGDTEYGTHYKISFFATDIANLPRKEERTLKTERKFGRYIKVEKLHIKGETQCIEVDSDDGLFLAGEGYIITHNTKSEFASWLLPAWWLGLNPADQIMQISHTAELAEGFGRKVRNLVDSGIYQDVFPNTALSKDSTAAARWNTSKGGKYVAMGVGGAVAGLGANLCLCKNSLVRIKGSNGLVRLGDIKVGDEIATVNGWERVSNKALTTHKNYYRINSDLKASGEHPFLTRRGWVQAKDLQVGDKIIIDSIWRKICRIIKTTLCQTLRENHGLV